MMNVRQLHNSRHKQIPLSLPICGIGLLLLMLVSSFALAKPDCDFQPNHPSCDGDSGGGSPSPFSAVIIEHDDGRLLESPLYQPGPDCVGKAHTQTNLTVLISNDDCATLITSEPGVFITQTRALNVLKDKKSGAVVSAWFFGQSIVDGGEVRAHISDEMVTGPLLVDLDAGESFPERSFVVHLHADNVELTRCNQARIKGNTVCDQPVGTFAIDDVVYFPTP